MVIEKERLFLMTDAEIEKEVAKKCGFRLETETPSNDSVCFITCEKPHPRSKFGVHSFIPCSSWDDSMEVLVNNKISLTWCDDGDALATDSMIDMECGLDCIESKSKNPKRAICEVFLQMEV